MTVTSSGWGRLFPSFHTVPDPETQPMGSKPIGIERVEEVHAKSCPRSCLEFECRFAGSEKWHCCWCGEHFWVAP